MAGDDLKHDAGKPRLELIDVWAERLLGMVLTAGALEYKPEGWRRLNTEEGRARVVGSLMRHLAAYRGMPSDLTAMDEQYGLPHSAHLLACAMFLAAFDAENLHAEDSWDDMEDTWRTAVEIKQRANKAQDFREAFQSSIGHDPGQGAAYGGVVGLSVPTGVSGPCDVDGSHGRRPPR